MPQKYLHLLCESQRWKFTRTRHLVEELRVHKMAIKEVVHLMLILSNNVCRVLHKNEKYKQKHAKVVEIQFPLKHEIYNFIDTFFYQELWPNIDNETPSAIFVVD